LFSLDLVPAAKSQAPNPAKQAVLLPDSVPTKEVNSQFQQQTIVEYLGGNSSLIIFISSA
jgi:hypothetical protein